MGGPLGVLINILGVAGGVGLLAFHDAKYRVVSLGFFALSMIAQAKKEKQLKVTAATLCFLPYLYAVYLMFKSPLAPAAVTYCCACRSSY
jgi:hypothetical protein